MALAVQEQNSTTNEIVRNVADAAQGASKIESNASSMVQAAQQIASGVSDTEKASHALTVTASELETLVGRFKLQSADRDLRALPFSARATAVGAR
jgi:methyl-accepting chemotaxis protein